MQSEASSYDVVVVGAGIQGLAQAWAAATRGERVLVLEADVRARAASVRNFGMIWPIGQPPGLRFELAMRSREVWLELAEKTEIYLRPSASLFVASAEDEVDLMETFVREASATSFEVELVDAATCRSLSPLVRSDAVLAGLSSKTELNVDPRQAVPAIAAHLQSSFGVAFLWQDAVCAVFDHAIQTISGRRFEASRILLCQGSAAAKLFPESFANAGLVDCKLQMMRSEALDRDMGPMLATALTLRHYESFRAAGSSLEAYEKRVATERPHLDAHGIHVMISQDSQGRLVLGDSHVYGAPIDDCRSEQVDRWILDELGARFAIDALAIEARWQGRYLKRPGFGVFVDDPAPGVRIVNGLGGNGMTLSFGLADRMWQDWDNAEILAGLPDASVTKREEAAAP